MVEKSGHRGIWMLLMTMGSMHMYQVIRAEEKLHQRMIVTIRRQMMGVEIHGMHHHMQITHRGQIQFR